MKNILISILLVICVSCGSTTLYQDGKPIARFEGDYKKLEYTNGTTSLKIDGGNHSKTNGIISTGIGSVGAGIVAYGLK